MPDLTEARHLLTTADNLLAALLDDDKIAEDHFRKISARTICAMADVKQFGNWSDKVIAALTVLQDEGHLQFSASSKGGALSYVYVRWLDQPGNAFPYMGLCEPMSAVDVQAVLGMIEGGISGVNKLTGQKAANLDSWSKEGIRSGRSDAREHLLHHVLRRYAETGSQLDSEPVTIDRFVKDAVAARKDRIRRIKEMRKAVADNPLPEPKPEVLDTTPDEVTNTKVTIKPVTPEPVKVEPEAVAEGPPMATKVKESPVKQTACAAPNCTRPASDGRALCGICEDMLARASGVGTIEPEAATEWRSESEMLVAQAASRRGLESTDAALLADGFHEWAEQVKAHGMGLEDVGVYVDGINLGGLTEQIREEYAGRAVQSNLRRNDGMVLAGGMEMNPLRLREITDQIDGTVREVDGMVLRPLLEDISGSPEARAALGRDGLKALKTLQARVAKLAALAAELGVELVEEDPMDFLDSKGS